MKILEYITKTFLLISFGVLFWINYTEVPVWKAFLIKNFSISDIAYILQNSENQQVAIIVHNKGNNVKRKKTSENFYTSIGINEKIFNGDILITDDLTFTKIKFLDGAEMDINPQSMVKIELEKPKDSLTSIAKMPKVEVYQGNITNKSEEIQLESIKPKNKPAIKLKNQVAVEKILKNKQMERNIASNPSPPIKVEEIRPMVPFVDEPSEIKTEPIESEISGLRANVGGRKIASNEYSPEFKDFFVDIHWEKVTNAEYYEISFFKEGNMFLKAKSYSNFFRLKEFFSGKIEYSVAAFNKGKRISKNISRFVEFSFNSPEAKNPSENSLISTDGPVMFTWSKKSFVEEYILEIKNLQNNTIKKVKVKDNFYSTEMPRGKAKWRVWAVNNSQLSNEPKWTSFEIEK